jgi:hypothetical protein
VVDATAIDGRRKLVIIRRDNAEHLLMIGGPTDVVVETNIVRSGAAVARDAPAVRSGATAGYMPSALPLPDPTPWPLQPEPVAAPAPAPVVRLEPPPRIDIDDLSPPRPAPLEPLAAPAAAARPRQAETLAGLAAELARPSPEVVAIPRPSRPVPARVAPQPMAPAPVESRAAPTDQNLAEMAQRLEAALRRPVGQPSTAKPMDGAARPSAAPAASEPPRAQPPPRQLKNHEKQRASRLGRPSNT